MMDTGIVISIVIPNYNSEKYIRETLESVERQSSKRFEVLVIDDGSTDSSPFIIREFCETRDNFHFYLRSSSAKGGNVCRNEGLKKAVGKFVMFLDSDDLLESYCIENRIEAIDANSGYNVIVFNQGVYRTDRTIPLKNKTNFNHRNPVVHFLVMNTLWQTTAPLWQTEFLRSIGGFNERFQRLQDPELIVRAFCNPKTKYILLKDSLPDMSCRPVPKMSMGMFKKRMESYNFYFKENKKYVDCLFNKQIKNYILNNWMVREIIISLICNEDYPKYMIDYFCVSNDEKWFIVKFLSNVFVYKCLRRLVDLFGFQYLAWRCMYKFFNRHIVLIDSFH